MDKDVIVSNVKPPYNLGFPYGSPIHLQCRRHRRNEFNPWVGRKWQPTPVFLLGKFQGQRSLTGYSTWDHRVRNDCARARTHTHTHTSAIVALYFYTREVFLLFVVCTFIYYLSHHSVLQLFLYLIFSPNYKFLGDQSFVVYVYIYTHIYVYICIYGWSQ